MMTKSCVGYRINGRVYCQEHGVAKLKSIDEDQQLGDPGAVVDELYSGDTPLPCVVKDPHEHFPAAWDGT